MPVEVDIRGDKAEVFPRFDHPTTITHARVFACRYENWDSLSELVNLTSLQVVEWMGTDLEALRPLTRLEQLHLRHMPKVSSLSPLGDLRSLRRLILETLPSWDGSKVTQVESLSPLRRLPLEEINMFGVRPESKAVDDLLAIPTLRRARLSKFSAKEIKRINEVVANEYVEWDTPSWGSAAEVERTKEALPSGTTFRSP
jgi:hypothetical protein